jgi:hypothetical protein
MGARTNKKRAAFATRFLKKRGATRAAFRPQLSFS